MNNNPGQVDRSGKYRWLGTFLLGVFVTLLVQQLGQLFLEMTDPTAAEGSRSVLAEGMFLITILVLAALSFWTMKRGRVPHPSVLFVAMGLFWLSVLV